MSLLLKFQEANTSQEFVTMWNELQFSSAQTNGSLDFPVSTDPPPSKTARCAKVNENIDEAIDGFNVGKFSLSHVHQTENVAHLHTINYILGLINIPFAQLTKPPEDSRLLRKSDPTFISKLKENMLKDPVAPGASPMAVLCREISKQSEFQEKVKNIYHYEVLGGLHTYIAKSQLAQEMPEIPYFSAEVYVGLSDEQALKVTTIICTHTCRDQVSN